MIVWPASLPRIAERSGYRGGLGEGRLQSPTDAGPGKSRRRFSFVPKPLAVQYKMTAVQREAFEAFVEGELAGGVMPFQLPNPIKPGTTIVVRFGQNMPSWTVLPGLRFMVSLDLLVLR